MSDVDHEYFNLLKEAGVSISDRNSKNAVRFMDILRRLELAAGDETRKKCIVCGANTYKDACVLIRPGEWARPRSFHTSDCILGYLMNEAHKEIAKEEEAAERIWRSTKGRKLMAESIERAKKVLAGMKSCKEKP